jgi:hypothetical protein
MKNKNLYIILSVLLLAAGGWVAYKYIFSKRSGSGKNSISVQSYIPNACWIYHEYVYRVDFADPAIPPFLFVRGEDGIFSPSNEEEPGNQATGNGFLVDSTGAAIISKKVARPWELTEEEQQPLRDLIDEWLDLRPNTPDRNYYITGQTVVLFVVLNDPNDFIEYKTTQDLPGQLSYSVIYPVENTRLSGIQPVLSFSDGVEDNKETDFQVLKATFNENSEHPIVQVRIDSITATRNSEGRMDNIRVISGDEFFNEGSLVFDKHSKLAGHLHYENEKWHLVSYRSIIQDPPLYESYELKEQWEFDKQAMAWRKWRTVNNKSHQP